MAKFNSSLKNVRVAAPCSVDWDSMIGNERRRFCGQCQLNVYNLSEMSRSEAERFVGQSEGRVCIRYYHRADGSIITRNCPVGLQALKRRVSRIATAVVSVLITFLASIGSFRLADGLKSMTSYRVGRVAGEMVMNPATDTPKPQVEEEKISMGKPMYTPSTPKRRFKAVRKLSVR